MLKEIIMTDYNANRTAKPQFATYVTPPTNIALQLVSGAYYDVVTVSLEGLKNALRDHLVILDTNNYPKCTEYLEAAGYIKPKPLAMLASGYCFYPVYELTEEAANLCDQQIAELTKEN